MSREIVQYCDMMLVFQKLLFPIKKGDSYLSSVSKLSKLALLQLQIEVLLKSVKRRKKKDHITN